MWIGIALVITTSGGFVTQAAPFFSEVECRASVLRITRDAEKSAKVLAYRLECIDAGTLTLTPTGHKAANDAEAATAKPPSKVTP